MKYWFIAAMLLSLAACGGSGGTNAPPDQQPQADSDSDGIPNAQDNCPTTSNQSQVDVDADGLGDACDSLIDTDRDGVANVSDNCPNISNSSQSDLDSDNLGDACDSFTDTDHDGIADSADNCDLVSNPSQADTDGDGLGDACDSAPPPKPDTDADGIPDSTDNCKTIKNADQADLDSDGAGDACDSNYGAFSVNRYVDALDDSVDCFMTARSPESRDGFHINFGFLALTLGIYGKQDVEMYIQYCSRIDCYDLIENLSQIRVDQNQAVSINAANEKTAATPYLVSTTSQSPDGYAGLLGQLQAGNQVTVRGFPDNPYFLSVTHTWSLIGFNQALAKFNECASNRP